MSLAISKELENAAAGAAEAIAQITGEDINLVHEKFNTQEEIFQQLSYLLACIEDSNEVLLHNWHRELEEKYDSPIDNENIGNKDKKSLLKNPNMRHLFSILATIMSDKAIQRSGHASSMVPANNNFSNSRVSYSNDKVIDQFISNRAANTVGQSSGGVAIR